MWADLLWSATLAFDLFGDLTADVALADRAVHTTGALRERCLVD